ncbi:YceI family protein [Puia dinghuensis]|uniref:Polyisoprenoid-binding protein n=1 Tax=Puia dinghuensis TaxID=1792502 RepID=A0A8J2UBF8_9BACT|nr:YceI family protein [Puia dinghuensis]GGA94116.1 polyisoprenoid-binding protein [Puia dinghuensis]
MKKIILSAAALILVAGSTFAQTWSMDKAHSQVNFGITHMGINEIDGSFGTVSATLTSSKDDFSDGVVEFTADMSSVNTGNEQRNNHLKSPDFFDAAKFATLTFKSTSFKKVSDKTYQVSGDLTLHGVTKPVTLTATFNGTTVNPMNKKTIAGFKVTGTIKRTDFGIGANFPAGMVSDDVTLVANTEFVKG